jgi:hypothetical protein
MKEARHLDASTQTVDIRHVLAMTMPPFEPSTAVTAIPPFWQHQPRTCRTLPDRLEAASL